jgi:fluoride exporter
VGLWKLPKPPGLCCSSGDMTNPLAASALVGAGGMAGSLTRYGLSLACGRFSVEWPYGTFASNLLGCLAIGAISALSDRAETLSPGARLFLTTGFCGGFTTMSSMIYETNQMLRSGEYAHASLYAGATFIGSMVAFLAGAVAVRAVFKHAGGLWS